MLAVGLPALWLGRRTAGVAPRPEIQFEVAPPPGTTFPDSVEAVALAISPDGLTMAFVAAGADGVSRIWTRMASELAARGVRLHAALTLPALLDHWEKAGQIEGRLIEAVRMFLNVLR